MNLNTLNRRIAAEGLPSLRIIANAITKIGDEMRTSGVTLVNPPQLITLGDLYIACGDLSYDYVRHPQDLPNFPSYGEWCEFMHSRPNGFTVQEAHCRHYGNERRYTKIKGVWYHTSNYDPQSEAREQGLYLPEGIREKVAKELNVGITPTFHAAFDLAVLIA